jgi:AbrB family looped-hinge helix DNA binding protein
MSLTRELRVGKKRTVVIPKAIAEALNIDEGSRLLAEVKDGYIILKPLPDAITLSLKGNKITKVTLNELENASIEEQQKRIGEN